MLQFIVGRAASGKTYQTVSLAADRVKCGENAVIIVPEQFSFECEKLALSFLGESLAYKLNVLSFSRIYDELNRITGGVCTVPISEPEKQILMKKAVKSVAKELKLFGKYAPSNGFIKKMTDTVTELKNNAIGFDELCSAAEKITDNTLKYKLLDTALILKEYDILVTERFIDPSDKLAVLYDKLGTYRFFEYKTVFIDSFDGFSGRQFKIIDRIISQCKDLYITLNMKSGGGSKYDIFENIRILKNRLTDMAERHSVGIADDIELASPHYNNKTLSYLENYLSGGVCGDDTLDDVTVCVADTVYDEAEFVARNIRKTVRERGARYKDFLVCARDTAGYVMPLKNAMRKNGIPCFLDERTSLLGTPVASAVLCAADLMRGLDTEKILKLYESVLGVFTPEELGTLKNYAYVWDINGKDWFREWDMNPDGFVSGKADEQRLRKINELRDKAIAPVQRMRSTCGKTTQEAVLAIVTMMDELKVADGCMTLYKRYKEMGDMSRADIIRQSYDSVISVLDSIVNIFKKDTLSAAELYDTLRSALFAETIGMAPQGIDEVIFGSADRIRPARPKYVFIMGANQGVFPRTGGVGGIFSVHDRGRLIECGLEINDCSVYDSVNEDYLVYANVCSASDMLFISCSSSLSNGTKGEMSAFLSQICSDFTVKTVREPVTLSADNLPETLQTAFSDMCRFYGNDILSTDTISAALEHGGISSECVNAFVKRPIYSITPQNAKKLFGDKVRMSPSKFDDFSRCRFMYFCKDVLGIRSLQKTEFDALQRGTIIHYVLQRAVEIHGKNLSALDKNDISDLVDKLIEEYLDSVVGFGSVNTARFGYLVYSMSRSLKTVVAHMAEEFKNTDFCPVACELVIGDNGDIPAVEIPVENDGTLCISGKIDRLDRYNCYVRIIDYKSGKRNFKLPDILFGQNMQMLIYLYAVCRDKKFGGDPAGILYMPSKRDKNAKDLAEKMSGLIIDDEDVISAMDRSDSGKFVPKPSSQTKNSFIPSESFEKIFAYIEKRLKSTGKAIYEGKMYVNPVDGLDSPACEHCEFKHICRIESNDILKVEKMSSEDVISEIERRCGTEYETN